MNDRESDFGYDKTPPPSPILSDEEREKVEVATWFRKNPRYVKGVARCSVRVELSDYPDFIDDYFST